MRTRLFPSAALLLILTAAPGALAQPDLDHCSAQSAASPSQVSVFTVPDGSGRPLSNCFLFGSYAVDATITVTLVDATMQPVVGFPAEDLWLVTQFGGLVLAPRGSFADGPTDVNGQTTFSAAVYGGGYSDRNAGEQTLVMIDGQPLASQPLDILFNSPDINGDLFVDEADAEIMQGDFATYHYRSDLNFDGYVNIADVGMLGAAVGVDGFDVDLAASSVASAATVPAVVTLVPDGGGDAFTAAKTMGGVQVDATITVTLINGDGGPVVGYPAARIGLATESGGAVFCPGHAIADAATDANGQTTFTAAPWGGGYSAVGEGERTVILLNEVPMSGHEVAIYYNSPDLDGDLHVECDDVDILEQDMGGDAFRSDFNADGVVNVSDLACFQLHHGANCLGLPDYRYCTGHGAATDTVSVLNVPNGAGRSLAAAYSRRGTRVDARITLTLVDSFGNPVAGYPAGDCELRDEAGNVAVCDEALIADGPSDADGRMIISGPFRAGGHTPAGAPTTLTVGGCSFAHLVDARILFNSPDVNGDLVVDLSDVAEVDADLGTSSYRSDFDFDGIVDSDDVAILAQHMASDCEGPITTAPAVGGGLVLRPNAPNPFNPRTTIVFVLPAAGPADLAVFDLRGRLVRRLVADGELAPGRHEAVWDGRDGRGRAAPSGVYCYRLQAGAEMATRRMVLLR